MNPLHIVISVRHVWSAPAHSTRRQKESIFSGGTSGRARVIKESLQWLDRIGLGVSGWTRHIESLYVTGPFGPFAPFGLMPRIANCSWTPPPVLRRSGRDFNGSKRLVLESICTSFIFWRRWVGILIATSPLIRYSLPLANYFE